MERSRGTLRHCPGPHPVAGAEHVNAPLVTADGPLVETFRGKQPSVLSLPEALAAGFAATG